VRAALGRYGVAVMAIDTKYNEGGTGDLRPYRNTSKFQRYKARVYAIRISRMLRISANFSANYLTGWATGDVDYY